MVSRISVDSYQHELSQSQRQLVELHQRRHIVSTLLAKKVAAQAQACQAAGCSQRAKLEGLVSLADDDEVAHIWLEVRQLLEFLDHDRVGVAC